MAETEDFWFTPKTQGYGADPANWKGWAAVLAFVAATTALSMSLLVFTTGPEDGLWAFSVVVWLILMLIVTVAFMKICRRKTDGEWRWRWSKKH